MRLKVTKSKNSASLYVIKSVYNPATQANTSKIVEKLGTEKELREKLGGADPYEWARNYIAELNQQEKEERRKVILSFSPKKIIKKDQQVSFHGGYLFLQRIYYALGLHRICADIKKHYKFTFDLNRILSVLVYCRILFPASKLATTEFSRKLIGQPDLQVHHVYRGLEFLAKENDMIQAQLYKNSCAFSKRNTGILFYDCTNFFFETEEPDGIRQYGKEKNNRPCPIVQMGLFIDGDGIPLAYSIHPGNTNEQITLKPLEKQILSDFGLSKFVVCTDAGLSSTANRRFNSVQNRAFITTQSIKKLKKGLKEWALAPEGWMLSGHPANKEGKPSVYNLKEVMSFYENPDTNAKDKRMLENKTFYKERWIKEDNLEQKMIITFSIKYKNYQAKVRNRQIERAEKLIHSGLSKLNKTNANDSRRFIKRSHCTADGEEAKHQILSIDQDIIAEEAMYDGFYAVCTNLEDDAASIVKINKGRWEIEESFRIMKTEFETRPIYLSREDRIQAHFLSCFIALVVYRLLEKELAVTTGTDSSYTCEEILDTLREMDFYKVEGEGYIPTYRRTDLTDLLHSIAGFRTDYEIVSNKEMKKIEKISKGK